MNEPSAPLEAEHFDGRSARPRRVQLRIAAGQLHIEGDGLAQQVPLAHVEWPERTRHGRRVTRLPDGGSLQALDAVAWDTWLRSAGVAESLVVRAQQHWRGTLLAALLLFALCAAGYLWGLPWAARTAVALLPTSADSRIGDAAMSSLDGSALLPSTLSAERQQQLRSAFARAVAHAYPVAQRPRAELQFRTSPKASDAEARPRLGPNAFALPGGTIVVTDELVELLQGRDDVLLGVLGHELGHVRQRHGMRQLVPVSLLGTVTSLALGDFSSVLAAAPALIGQMAYSRDFEREADAEAIRFLRANELSPAVMIELFNRLGASRPAPAVGSAPERGFDPGIAFASHPRDAERVQFFRNAAAH